MSDEHRVQASNAYSHALRVTFSYDANAITLGSVRRIAMRVLAPARLPPTGKAVGHWLAVEDLGGKILYHIPLHNPLQYDREVFAPGADGKATRVASTATSGSFDVLVPDLQEGVRLVLHGPGHKPSEGRAFLTRTAEPLLTADLDDLRQRAVLKERSGASSDEEDKK
jgi:hypothetical protein